MKRVCPSTKYNALRFWLVGLKVQQVTDQRLDLRSVTPEALHSADSIEDVLVDSVVLDHTSGLGDRFVVPSLLCIGTVLQAKLLELLSINRNAEFGLQQIESSVGNIGRVPAYRANFPFFPCKPGFQAVLIKTFSVRSSWKTIFTWQKTCALRNAMVRTKTPALHANSPSCDETSQKFGSVATTSISEMQDKVM